METSISRDRKQRAVTPDIGAVAGDIERKITEDFHAKVARQGTELAPLTIEMPLKKILLKQVTLMSATPLLQCRIAVDRQLVWPGPPRQTCTFTTQHHEGGVITEPTRLIDTPPLKGLVAIGRLL